jgi:hypothetical protein
MLTWAAVDVGFCLVRSGRLARARELFEKLSRSNPEVLGVRRIVDLIREKESEPPAEGRNERRDIREKTDRVVSKKRRRYELWEYVERWEEEATRPFHLMAACGFVARKRLDPGLLSPDKGQGRKPGSGPGR